MNKPAQSTGFTIVELLIVIVVIAILAGITLVAFNGVQSRARDTQRISDMRSITTALKLYSEQYGTFPVTQNEANAWSWEVSHTASGPTDFLSALHTSNVVSKVPVEPSSNPIKNTTANQYLSPSRSSENFNYFYFVYQAGQNGCPIERGPYYILGATRMDSVPSGQTHPQSPGFSCPGRSWLVDGAWVTGGFLK